MRLVTGLSPKARVRSHISPCEICRTKWHLNTLFSHHFAFPSYYHSAGAPYKPLFAWCSYKMGKNGQSKQVMLFRKSGSTGYNMYYHCFTFFGELNSSTFLTFSSCGNILIQSINPKDSYSAVRLWTCIRDVFHSNTGLDWGASSFSPCLSNDCHDSTKK
jgi:hypothetical protein